MVTRQAAARLCTLASCFFNTVSFASINWNVLSTGGLQIVSHALSETCNHGRQVGMQFFENVIKVSRTASS